jgi:hypothetical protein
MIQAVLELPGTSHGPEHAAQDGAAAPSRPPLDCEARIRALLEGRHGMGAMDCPFCPGETLYFGRRRDGTLSALCSCPGGILICDAGSLEPAPRPEPPPPPASWLEKSQPPEL